MGQCRSDEARATIQELYQQWLTWARKELCANTGRDFDDWGAAYEYVDTNPVKAARHRTTNAHFTESKSNLAMAGRRLTEIIGRHHAQQHARPYADRLRSNGCLLEQSRPSPALM
jgi:hypothetical protein